MMRINFKIATVAYLLLAINFNAFSQQAVHPRKGEITFEAEARIIDKVAFSKSADDARKMIVAAVKANFLKQPEYQKLDTNVLNRVLETVKSETLAQSFLERDKHLFTYIYQDTVIVPIAKELPSDAVINIKTGMVDIGVKGGDIASSPYEYDLYQTISIMPFKNERKKIHGYDCYKVIFKYRQGKVKDIDAEFADIINQTEFSQELWVTESIQSMYHPINQQKEILLKYYPLEIIESNSMIKGLEIIYHLKSITLTN